MNVYTGTGKRSIILTFEKPYEFDDFLTKLGESLRTDAQISADVIRASQALGDDPSESLEGS